jgi:hypothetical protein
MAMRGLAILSVLALSVPAWAGAYVVPVTTGQNRSGSVSLMLGGYTPDVDAGLSQVPYQDSFGKGNMLLFQLEVDHFLYQGIGTFGVGASIGYGEKYGFAHDTQTGAASAERIALKLVPLRLLALYRFDYAAFHWHVPLVPYVKVALGFTPWWALKGGNVEYYQGKRGAGGEWGFGLTGGLAFELDVLQPRLAKDLQADTGIDHTYLFAEYRYERIDDWGKGGLNLSDNHWMFGLAFDF